MFSIKALNGNRNKFKFKHILLLIMKTKVFLFLFFLSIISILNYGCKEPALSKNLPILTTNEVTAISQNTAQCGGEITSDNGIDVTVRGVCWSLQPYPTTSDSLTKNAAGTGKFVSNIYNLLPDTTYYLRAYATNSDGTAYGLQVTFKTLKGIFPTLTTTKASNITSLSVTSGGNISFNGGTDVSERGVCWSTTTFPTVLDNKTSDGKGNGNFTSSITLLSAGTIYYVRAYAINKTGIGYGNQDTIKTHSIPTITTNSISNITNTTANSGGNVTSDGETAITARGVVWSTSQNPTIILTTKTTNGVGNGMFTSDISGLNPSTTYYVRAYATNSLGTAYGNELIFRTSDTYTDQRDGNVYHTVIIGNQTWMAENLRYLPSVTGPATGSETIPYYYVNDYNGTSVNEAKATSNYNTYGVLYNWPAACSSCPAGWHLPTDAEWTQMENYLSENGYNYDGTTGDIRAKIAKSLADTKGWVISTNTGSVGNTDYSEYRNKSGFKALPGASRSTSGVFNSPGYMSYWWNATEYSTQSASQRYLRNSDINVFRLNGPKGFGLSVRCVKD